MMPDSQFTNFIQIQSIGNILYTHGALWLILASLILLLSIVGPIVLSQKTNE
jgi:NADH-ubiquinone oxidoreductase chain 6